MPIPQNIRTYDNSNWLLLFYQNSPNGENHFANEGEALYFVGNDNKYSILSCLNPKFKIRGFYEFMIEYPDLNAHNRWKQKVNPLDITEDFKEQVVSGYTPIDVQFNNNSWGGLIRTGKVFHYSEPPSLLNGSPGVNYWYFAIGVYQGITYYYDPHLQYYSNIPGPGVPTNSVILWLRLAKNSDCTIQTIRTHNIYCVVFLLLFLN